MPTYEYKCEACGKHFEKFQSMTAAPVDVCPLCHKKPVKRLISGGAGIIFKGSGFYETDYRSDSYRAAARSESSVSAPAKPATETAASPTPSSSSTPKPATKAAASPAK